MILLALLSSERTREMSKLWTCSCVVMDDGADSVTTNIRMHREVLYVRRSSADFWNVRSSLIILPLPMNDLVLSRQ